jgi:type VI secretion system protein ImpA
MSLEYDERYVALESLWEEQLPDHGELPPERNSNDWRRAVREAEALLAESADLRIACWLLRANLKLSGLPALLAGVARIADLLKMSGPHLHPLADEGHPASAYASAIAWLGTPQCLHEVRAVRLHEDHASTVKDFVESPETLRHGVVPDGGALRDCAARLEEIEGCVNEPATGYFLDIQHLATLLRSIAAACDIAAPPIAFDTEAEDNNTVVPPLAAVICRSRSDAFQMLDTLVDYFRVNEPSHPAPIFLRRIQRTIGMDFEGIVNELMPEAAPGLSRLTGS